MFELGQEVFIYNRHDSQYVKGVVERVTKTQAIVNGYRYDRNTGWPWSKFFSKGCIYPATSKYQLKLDQAIERTNQEREEKRIIRAAREKDLAARKALEMATFKAAVPNMDVDLKTLPDGSRLYSVLLPGNPNHSNGNTFKYVIVRAFECDDYINHEIQRCVRLFVTWCHNRNESFPSQSGYLVPVTEERNTLEEICSDLWNRSY